MLTLIKDNPFRILGVFANSPMKDIVSNKGRIAAFAKVGKAVDFPMDINMYVPSVSRTTDSITDAESKIALAQDKLKYGMFWFVKTTPMDEIAINHLTSGNIDMAVSIWSKTDSFSSLQNRVICGFIQDDVEKVVSCIVKLFNAYTNEVVDAYGANTLGYKEYDLIHVFVDSLVSYGYDIKKFSTLVPSGEWKNYLNGKLITPLINSINEEILIAQKAKGFSARKNAGVTLYKNTADAISDLKKSLGASNMQYQMIADKLANEILQCGIDYFNGSKSANSFKTAITFVKVAKSIAAGSIVKERCEDNLNTIQDMEKNSVIESDVDAIVEQLKRSEISIASPTTARGLVQNCLPHLQNIANALGSSSEQYTEAVSAVANNAMGILVEAVNEAQKDAVKVTNGTLRNIINDSISVMSVINNLSMNGEVRSRYNRDIRALRDLKDKVDLLHSQMASLSSKTNRTSGYTPTSKSSSNDESSAGCIWFIVIIIIIACISQCH